MKKFYLLLFILQATSQSFSMNNKACDPASFTLILPPAATYHKATGLPPTAYIGQPFATTSASPATHDTHLTHVLSLVKNEQYKEALTELNLFKDLPSEHFSELHIIKQELDNANEKLTDQQYEILENVDVIGCAGFCCLLLNEPLKSVLPLPPDTEWALYSTTACIFYRCCQHANKTCALTSLQKKLAMIITVPPMYTVIIPPPVNAMEYKKINVTLESRIKKDYDGSRTRTQKAHNSYKIFQKL